MSWIVENRWSCSSCQMENLGRYTRCQGCGNPKENDEAASERVDSKATVSDQKLLTQASEGAHWTCSFCGSKERAPSGDCAGCGGKRAAPARPRPRAALRNSVPASGLKSQKKWIWAVAVGVLSMVLLGAMFLPHHRALKVVRSHWIRNVTYQVRTVQHGESWGSPAGAFDVHCRTEQHGEHACGSYTCGTSLETYSCRCHTCNCRDVCTNLKNGFSRCNKSCSTCCDTCSRPVPRTCTRWCPTWDQRCSYNHFVWVSQGEKTASGAYTDSMTWPEFSPIDETHRVARQEIYTVRFSNGEDMFPKTEHEYLRYRPGAKWNVKTGLGRDPEPLEEMK